MIFNLNALLYFYKIISLVLYENTTPKTKPLRKGLFVAAYICNVYQFFSALNVLIFAYESVSTLYDIFRRK